MRYVKTCTHRFRRYSLASAAQGSSALPPARLPWGWIRYACRVSDLTAQFIRMTKSEHGRRTWRGARKEESESLRSSPTPDASEPSGFTTTVSPDRICDWSVSDGCQRCPGFRTGIPSIFSGTHLDDRGTELLAARDGGRRVALPHAQLLRLGLPLRQPVLLNCGKPGQRHTLSYQSTEATTHGRGAPAGRRRGWGGTRCCSPRCAPGPSSAAPMRCCPVVAGKSTRVKGTNWLRICVHMCGRRSRRLPIHAQTQQTLGWRMVP